jgi:hypothetical protein
MENVKLSYKYQISRRRRLRYDITDVSTVSVSSAILTRNKETVPRPFKDKTEIKKWAAFMAFPTNLSRSPALYGYWRVNTKTDLYMKIHVSYLTELTGAAITYSRYRDGLRVERSGLNCRQRQDLSLLHSVHAGSGGNRAAYWMCTGGSFPRGKAVGAWSWPLTSMLCRGQEWWSYTSTPPCVSTG